MKALVMFGFEIGAFMLFLCLVQCKNHYLSSTTTPEKKMTEENLRRSQINSLGYKKVSKKYYSQNANRLQSSLEEYSLYQVARFRETKHKFAGYKNA